IHSPALVNDLFKVAQRVTRNGFSFSEFFRVLINVRHWLFCLFWRGRDNNDLNLAPRMKRHGFNLDPSIAADLHPLANGLDCSSCFHSSTAFFSLEDAHSRSLTKVPLTNFGPLANLWCQTLR